MKIKTLSLLIALLWVGQVSAQEQWATGFPSAAWHDGFTRYDFIMDSATLSIQPIKMPARPQKVLAWARLQKDSAVVYW